MKRHDSFEKYYNNKTKKYIIERLEDNFNVHGGILTPNGRDIHILDDE
jgi:hypothetical protein